MHLIGKKHTGRVLNEQRDPGAGSEGGRPRKGLGCDMELAAARYEAPTDQQRKCQEKIA